MNTYIRAVLFFLTLGSASVVCFGQTPEIPDPRPLAREFELTLRGNHQPGGSVVSMPDCTTRDPGGRVANLPKAKTRLLQIEKANPEYFVTNTDVPNFLPKNYEPDLLKARVNRYMLDSDDDAISALGGLLDLKELQPAIETSGLHKGLDRFTKST